MLVFDVKLVKITQPDALPRSAGKIGAGVRHGQAAGTGTGKPEIDVRREARTPRR